MIAIYSKNSVPIRITQERWEHITRRHPEMFGQKEKVMETISNPDIIQMGDFGELLAVRFYTKTPLTKKIPYCCLQGGIQSGWIYPDSLLCKFAIRQEEGSMEALKILEGKPSLNWEFDEEADVLYISVGKPRPAIGTDIGEGVIVRYDKKKKEVVGITIIGFRARTLQSISGKQDK